MSINKVTCWKLSCANDSFHTSYSWLLCYNPSSHQQRCAALRKISCSSGVGANATSSNHSSVPLYFCPYPPPSLLRLTGNHSWSDFLPLCFKIADRRWSTFTHSERRKKKNHQGPSRYWFSQQETLIYIRWPPLGLRDGWEGCAKQQQQQEPSG